MSLKMKPGLAILAAGFFIFVNSIKALCFTYSDFMKIFIQLLFIALLLLTVIPQVTAPVALVLGVVYVNIFGFPFDFSLSKWTSNLLKTCIVGIGFGIPASAAMSAGMFGVLLTLGIVAFTLSLGLLLIQLMHVSFKTGNLINSGTAICGGSAIAAMAPILKARNEEVSTALGTIFTLNAIALLLFPYIGKSLDMTSEAFGIWSALAIHDTSSVVGAASAYSNEALNTATTIKVIRTLWIIPLAGLVYFLYKRQYPFEKPGNSRANLPWFIPLFALSIILGSFLPVGQSLFDFLYEMARYGFVAVLFLVGAGLPLSTLKNTGWKPFMLGTMLWLIMAVFSLVLVLWMF